MLLLVLVFCTGRTCSKGVALVLANVVMGVVAPILWYRLAPYQQNRLLTFLDPSIDPRHAGWHVLQSKVAIGSGGWVGKGYLAGSQKRLAFLPEQHTDFIFAVLGEELGFIGVAVALALFLVLLRRSVRIAANASEPVGSLTAFGLAAVWVVHIVVNVGMTLNLMPITGIPLPFFSYGGIVHAVVLARSGCSRVSRVKGAARRRANTRCAKSANWHRLRDAIGPLRRACSRVRVGAPRQSAVCAHRFTTPRASQAVPCTPSSGTTGVVRP